MEPSNYRPQIRLKTHFSIRFEQSHITKSTQRCWQHVFIFTSCHLITTLLTPETKQKFPILCQKRILLCFLIDYTASNVFFNYHIQNSFPQKEISCFINTLPQNLSGVPQKPIKLGLKISFCKASQCHLYNFLASLKLSKGIYFIVQEHFSCFLISYSLIFSFCLELGSDFPSFITTIISTIQLFLLSSKV